MLPALYTSKKCLLAMAFLRRVSIADAARSTAKKAKRLF